MTYWEALQIAGQCWCDPETSNIEVDIRLANAIAKRLQAAYAAGRKAGLEEAAELAAEHIASESSIVGLVLAIRALNAD
jgi:hypothetical protein